MYISCPSCSTSFNVDGVNIGTNGRAVRCFNCNHTWHQYQAVHQPQPQYVPVQYVSPGQFAVPPIAPAPQPQFTPPPAPELSPSPAPEPIPEEDLPSEEELDAALGATEEGDTFDEAPIEEPNEISLEDLEALEDPEPLEAFTPDPDDEEDEENKGGIVKTLIKTLIILIIFGGIGTGAVFMRGIVVDLIPSSNVVFELIGLRVAIPGEGLNVNAGDPKKEKINDQDWIIVKGLVRNVSDVEQLVPILFVRILDVNKQLIGVNKVTPSVKSLKPNGQVKFETKFLEAKILTGRDVDIVYGPFQDKEGGEQK